MPDTANTSSEARASGSVGRQLLVFLAYVAGAAVFTFPLVLNMGNAVKDVGDPLLDAWAFGWVAHQAVRDPAHLFDSNRYYPETGTLAFTDPMLALTVPMAPIQLVFDNPVLTLNIAMLLSLGLSGYGAYRLVHHLTGDAVASGVAGSIFAFNPYRLSHLAHVNLQAAGFIPLVFLYLTLFLEEGRTRYAVGLGLSLWLVSASCAYYGVFTWTILAVAVPYELWRARAKARANPRRVVGLALAFSISALAYLPLALPLLRLDHEFGMKRPVDRLQRQSARPADYLRSGARLHQAMGLEPPARGRNLFPGIVALVLGLLAMARPNRVAGLYALIGVLAAWASLGPAYGLYRFLYDFVPGISGLRAPPRFIIFVMLALAVLAGLAVSRMRWLRARIPRLVLAPVLVALPLAESSAIPNPYTEAPEFPAVYDWLKNEPHPSPIAEVPLTWALHKNAIYLYWSTRHFQPIANGHSTLVPPVFGELRRAMGNFPDEESMRLLERRGFAYVILHRDLYLRQRAQRIEEAMDAEPGLRVVHRTANETVYEVLGRSSSP